MVSGPRWYASGLAPPKACEVGELSRMVACDAEGLLRFRTTGNSSPKILSDDTQRTFLAAANAVRHLHCCLPLCPAGASLTDLAFPERADPCQLLLRFVGISNPCFITRKTERRGRFLLEKLVSLGPLYYAILLICIAIELRNHSFPVPVVLSDLALVQTWFSGIQMGLNPPAWFMLALIFCLSVYPLLCKPLASRPLCTSLAVIGGYWLVIQAATISWRFIRSIPRRLTECISRHFISPVFW